MSTHAWATDAWKKLWAAGLGLTLSWSGSAWAGEEGAWRTARPSTGALAATLGQPQAPDAGPSPASAVRLGRPVIGNEASAVPTDGGLRQVSFRRSADLGAGIVRAQSADETQPTPLGPPQPMPTGDFRTWVGPPGVVPSYPVPDQAEFVADNSVHPLFAGTFAGSWLSWTGTYGESNRFYAGAEYLLWAVKSQPGGPLVLTTGPLFPQIGGLPANLTAIPVAGADNPSNPVRSGVRTDIGYWLGPAQLVGLEGEFFFLGKVSTNALFTSSAIPVLSRPFINANLGIPDSEIVAAPGIAKGAFRIDTSSRLWGAQANVRGKLWCENWCRVDGILGFRYIDLDESMVLTEFSQILPNNPFPRLLGSSFILQDGFETRNQFFGGQLGLITGFHWRRWSLDLLGKIALGSNRQTVDINGYTVQVAPNGVLVSSGGLLALPGANIGQFTRSSFSVAPEAGITIGFQLTDHIKATIGYSVLIWTGVLRPGDQIDPKIDFNRVPSFRAAGVSAPPLLYVTPVVPFKETVFWAQGMNVGLEFVW
ncbi:MAG: BBP7 family outer membrane beta-barrel protein [Gemmataceae bacterium]|nr:BBP7 family outer membrane beta-barrel protein [Gemmataceae bacterium]MDW8264859.1 BBP7 family outer membrane beta-barrel protein [Gemmataceae bacterium]